MKGLLFLLTMALAIPNITLANSPWFASNSDIINQHIIPRYQQLQVSSQQLLQQSQAMCESPSEASLEKTRQAYQKTMDAWIGVQHLRFGPVELFDRYHRYQLWPDKHNTGNKQLRKLLAKADPELLTIEYNFNRTSVAVQGLSAVEKLLFSKGRGIALYVDDNHQANYRCLLITAISRNLNKMSQALSDTWQSKPAPLQLMLTAAEVSLHDNMDEASMIGRKEVAIGFFNNLYTQVQSVIDQKLQRAMGKHFTKSKPRYLESWRSQRSLRNITLNIQALESLYNIGFSSHLNLQGQALNNDIHQAFKEIHQAVAMIDQPLNLAIDDAQQYLKVTALQQSVRRLQSLLTGPLPKALDIPLGFNSLDGD